MTHLCTCKLGPGHLAMTWCYFVVQGDRDKCVTDACFRVLWLKATTRLTEASLTRYTIMNAIQVEPADFVLLLTTFIVPRVGDERVYFVTWATSTTFSHCIVTILRTPTLKIPKRDILYASSSQGAGSETHGRATRPRLTRASRG